METWSRLLGTLVRAEASRPSKTTKECLEDNSVIDLECPNQSQASLTDVKISRDDVNSFRLY